MDKNSGSKRAPIKARRHRHRPQTRNAMDSYHDNYGSLPCMDTASTESNSSSEKDVSYELKVQTQDGEEPKSPDLKDEIEGYSIKVRITFIHGKYTEEMQEKREILGFQGITGERKKIGFIASERVSRTLSDVIQINRVFTISNLGFMKKLDNGNESFISSEDACFHFVDEATTVTKCEDDDATTTSEFAKITKNCYDFVPLSDIMNKKPSERMDVMAFMTEIGSVSLSSCETVATLKLSIFVSDSIASTRDSSREIIVFGAKVPEILERYTLKKVFDSPIPVAIIQGVVAGHKNDSDSERDKYLTVTGATHFWIDPPVELQLSPEVNQHFQLNFSTTENCMTPNLYETEKSTDKTLQERFTTLSSEQSIPPEQLIEFFPKPTFSSDPGQLNCSEETMPEEKLFAADGTVSHEKFAHPAQTIPLKDSSGTEALICTASFPSPNLPISEEKTINQTQSVDLEEQTSGLAIPFGEAFTPEQHDYFQQKIVSEHSICLKGHVSPQEPISLKDFVSSEHLVSHEGPKSSKEPILQEARQTSEPAISMEGPVPSQEHIFQEGSMTSEEPVSHKDPLSPEESISVEGPMTPEEPISSEDSITSEEPISHKDPLSPEEPISHKDPLSPEEPISHKDPLSPEEPISIEGPMTPEEPISLEGSIASEEPISFEGPMTHEEAISSEGSITPEEPISFEGPMTHEEAIFSEGSMTPQSPFSSEALAFSEEAPPDPISSEQHVSQEDSTASELTYGPVFQKRPIAPEPNAPDEQMSPDQFHSARRNSISSDQTISPEQIFSSEQFGSHEVPIPLERPIAPDHSNFPPISISFEQITHQEHSIRTKEFIATSEANFPEQPILLEPSASPEQHSVSRTICAGQPFSQEKPPVVKRSSVSSLEEEATVTPSEDFSTPKTSLSSEGIPYTESKHLPSHLTVIKTQEEHQTQNQLEHVEISDVISKDCNHNEILKHNDQPTPTQQGHTLDEMRKTSGFDKRKCLFILFPIVLAILGSFFWLCINFITNDHLVLHYPGCEHKDDQISLVIFLNSRNGQNVEVYSSVCLPPGTEGKEESCARDLDVWSPKNAKMSDMNFNISLTSLETKNTNQLWIISYLEYFYTATRNTVWNRIKAAIPFDSGMEDLCCFNAHTQQEFALDTYAESFMKCITSPRELQKMVKEAVIEAIAIQNDQIQSLKIFFIYLIAFVSWLFLYGLYYFREH